MKRLVWLLLSALAFGQGTIVLPKTAVLPKTVVLSGTSGGGGGIVVSDFTPTVQASGHTCTIASITLATGDSIAAFSDTPALAGSISATWNSISMTQVGGGISAGPPEVHAFHSDNVAGATGSLVMTKTNAGDDALVFNCVAVKITGLTTKAMDQTSTNTGSATTYDTGTTPTTTAANEGLVAFIGLQDNSTSGFGTWQNSFVRLQDGGQGAGACCAFDYASRVVSSTGTYIGQTTGGFSHNFAGFILTFK